MDSAAQSQIELNKKYGKRLVAVAWIIEIIAASLGLFIGIYGAYFAYDYYQSTEGTISGTAVADIYIGSAVFIIIAAVELTKIPLVLGFYRTKILAWKILFFATLLFLITVTFETMFNGLERGFSNTEGKIQGYRTSYQTTKKNLLNIEREIEEVNSRTVEDIDEEYSERFANLRLEKDSEVKALYDSRDSETGQIYEQIRGLESSFSVIASSTGLQESVARLQKDLDEIKNQANKSIEEVRSTTLQRIENIDIAIQQINQEETEQLEGRIFGGAARQAADAKRQPLIAERDSLSKFLESRVSALELKRDSDIKSKEVQLEKARQDLLSSQGNFSGTLNNNINSLNDRIASISERYSTRELDLVNRYDVREEALQIQKNEAIDRQRTRELKIPSLEQKRESVRNEIVSLENSINVEARGNNIYRITARFYNRESAADIRVEELKVVTTIWFGSIALIAALVGSILALAGYVLQDPDSYVPPKKDNFNLFENLKGLLLDIRKRLRSPVIKYEKVQVPYEVEKIKEVPGPEKVVYKEVPKEIVKNEIVYVPLYSVEDGTILKEKDQKK
tara:strand:+ start:206 stop:1903 length:1698 start_codon:yes stop_codon:yes gene_type:complete